MRLFTTVIALISLATAASAVADSNNGELNNEGAVTNVQQRTLAADLPMTLVVRTTLSTHAVSILPSNKALVADPSSMVMLTDAAFVAVKATDKVQSTELDRDSSTDSWFFYFNNYNYYNPCFYSGGYNYYYNNYYSYNYGPYSYSYYHWRRW